MKIQANQFKSTQNTDGTNSTQKTTENDGSIFNDNEEKNYFETTRDNVLDGTSGALKDFLTNMFDAISNFFQGLQDALKEQTGIEYDFFNIDPEDETNENTKAVSWMYKYFEDNLTGIKNSVMGKNTDKK